MIASLFSILSILFLTSCEQFGNIPSGEYKLSLSKSENYDLNQDKFVNQEIGVIEKMTEEGSFWKKPLKNLKDNELQKISPKINTKNTLENRDHRLISILSSVYGASCLVLFASWPRKGRQKYCMMLRDKKFPY